MSKEAEKPQEPVTTPPEVSAAVAKATLEEQMAALDRLERTTGPSGAPSNATKGMMLDGSDTAALHPSKRLRWVNVGIAEKVQLRQSQGYVRVPVAEGGRQVGNLALFALSKEVYEGRVEDIKKENERRLRMHKVEVEAEADAIAKVLRDKHGIRAKVLIEEH